jgi:hypothetical protein
MNVKISGNNIKDYKRPGDTKFKKWSCFKPGAYLCNYWTDCEISLFNPPLRKLKIGDEDSPGVVVISKNNILPKVRPINKVLLATQALFKSGYRPNDIFDLSDKEEPFSGLLLNFNGSVKDLEKNIFDILGIQEKVFYDQKLEYRIIDQLNDYRIKQQMNIINQDNNNFFKVVIGTGYTLGPAIIIILKKLELHPDWWAGFIGDIEGAE